MKEQMAQERRQNIGLAVEQTTETLPLSFIHFWAANETVACFATVAKQQITFPVKDPHLSHTSHTFS